MSIEIMDIQGTLIIQKYTRNWQLIEEFSKKNSIVLTGRELIAKLFKQGNQNDSYPISHISVGVGSREVNITDSKLDNEVYRKVIDPSKTEITEVIYKTPDGKDSTRIKLKLSTSLNADEAIGQTLTECALFAVPENTQEKGIMYNRVVFSPIRKTAEFQLTLIWEILF